MANKYTVRYLLVAVDDLTSIFDWIADDNPAGAGAFIKKLDRHIRKLKEYPLLGRIPRDEKLTEFGYRVLIVESYLAFYVIRGKTIEIHRVIHGSRNLEEII
ncbi:MAG TPA: type II toxin-antitoxin system RelE/ParE family toxin [Syntrophorhabdaceae bacterium]|nr:type II toxin-antitoxin system RelE/ParE family toxin [Syntrophorhabdaceae bacterium]